MALDVVQARHGAPVVIVAAFVVLLLAATQLVLDYLKNKILHQLSPDTQQRAEQNVSSSTANNRYGPNEHQV